MEEKEAKQLLVNGVFFIVYPCVLCYRWYLSKRWKLWTEYSEKDDFARYVEYSREEEELLRHGMIRGRMIVQKEIVLTDTMEDELSSYRKYDDVDDCVIAVEKGPLEAQSNPSECEPLNLSKDGVNNEEIILMECPREDSSKLDTNLSSSEEERDDDEISLIPQSSKTYQDASSSAYTGGNR
uniref:Uncharacterized protein n=1 Tax=Anopheles funestus TaxID=62324 RepID=A0A182R5L2_ANOFN